MKFHHIGLESAPVTLAKLGGGKLAAKEATARVKINRLLEEAGWRFFDDTRWPANIVLKPNTKIAESQINELGEDFEKVSNGFIDFLDLYRFSSGRLRLYTSLKETNYVDQAYRRFQARGNNDCVDGPAAATGRRSAGGPTTEWRTATCPSGDKSGRCSDSGR